MNEQSSEFVELSVMPYGPAVLRAGDCYYPKGGTRIDYKNKNSYRLIGLLDGSVNVDFANDGTNATFEAPNILLLQPQNECTLKLTSQTHLRMIIFDLLYQPRRVDASGLVHAGKPERQPPLQKIFGTEIPLTLPRKDVERYLQILAVIRDQYWRDGRHWSLACGHLALLIAELAIQTSESDEVSTQAGDPLTNIFKTIAASYPKFTTVAELAGRCGMSREHFSRMFKERFNMSPSRWLEKERWAWARRMLIHEDYPIAGIAKCLRYRSAAGFTRAFTKAMGCSPKAYRQKYRAQY